MQGYRNDKAYHAWLISKYLYITVAISRRFTQIEIQNTKYSIVVVKNSSRLLPGRDLQLVTQPEGHLKLIAGIRQVCAGADTLSDTLVPNCLGPLKLKLKS